MSGDAEPVAEAICEIWEEDCERTSADRNRRGHPCEGGTSDGPSTLYPQITSAKEDDCSFPTGSGATGTVSGAMSDENEKLRQEEEALLKKELIRGMDEAYDLYMHANQVIPGAGRIFMKSHLHLFINKSPDEYGPLLDARGIKPHYCIMSRGGFFKKTLIPGKFEFYCPSCVSDFSLLICIPDLVDHQISETPIGIRIPLTQTGQYKLPSGVMRWVNNVIKVKHFNITKECRVDELVAMDFVGCCKCGDVRFERNDYKLCYVCSAHLYTDSIIRKQ